MYFSLIAALVCLLAAGWMWWSHLTLALLPAALAVWFLVDAARSWRWATAAEVKKPD